MVVDDAKDHEAPEQQRREAGAELARQQAADPTGTGGAPAAGTSGGGSTSGGSSNTSSGNVMKQWLTLPVDGKPMKMNTPGFMFQWQNAVYLPFDIWLNVDAQLMTRSWDNNMKLSNTPWYVNAKIYKGFFNNAFSVTLEAKDLFSTSQHDAMMYNDVVKIVQKNYSPGRSVMLTLQYRFNTTRDRYRGTGAGNSEKSRF